MHALSDTTTHWQEGMERHQALGLTRARLEARREEALTERTRLTTEVAQAKARIEVDDEIKGCLEALQRSVHERAVGAYERLLTSLLQDTLPGFREVVLELTMERGVPSLDVFIRKSKGGPLEDPFDAAGGSVANILSVGLRLIALVRSGRRPFLVLDEPDCWIQPMRVATFIRVLQQVAHHLGVQILLISHHDEEASGHVPYRTLLKVGEQGLQVEQQGIHVWAEDQRGVRSITLEGVQAHSATHIPLGPGVTLLSGNNDIGKSAVVAGLRALYGESHDTLINHDAPTARVLLDLGPEGLLQWERHRTGKTKIAYRLLSPDPTCTTPLASATGARTKDIPDWLGTQLGFGAIEGLDVQVGHQKRPVFLLNDPAPTRAKALAVGMDSGYVHQMMRLARQDVTEVKERARQGEKKLETLRHTLHVLHVLEHPAPEGNVYAAEQRARSVRQRAAQTLLEKWEPLIHRVRSLVPLRTRSPVTLPRRSPSSKAQDVTQRWRRAACLRDTLEGIVRQKGVQAPLAPRVARVRTLADTWRHVAGRALLRQRLETHAAPRTPSLSAVARERALERRWKTAAQRRSMLELIGTSTQQGVTLKDNVLERQGRYGERFNLLTTWRQRHEALLEQHQALKVSRDEEGALLHALETMAPPCPTCGAWQRHASH